MTRTAFTLVELIVVMAVIALLIAILLPAIGKARELSRRVVCASNFRQLGIACTTYAQDWRGTLPYLPDSNGEPTGAVAFNSTVIHVPDKEGWGADGWAFSLMLDAGLGGQFDVTSCPSLGNAPFDAPDNATRHPAAYGPFLYFAGRINPLFDRPDDTIAPVKLSQSHPEDVLWQERMLLNTNNGKYEFNHGTGAVVQFDNPSSRTLQSHDADDVDGGNLLHYDGSVRFTPFGETVDVGYDRQIHRRVYSVMR